VIGRNRANVQKLKASMQDKRDPKMEVRTPLTRDARLEQGKCDSSLYQYYRVPLDTQKPEIS